MNPNQPTPPDGTLPDDSLAQRKDLAHQACADLRFAEGLRRRSAEARAEAAVQEAVSAAWLEGGRADAKSVREEVMALESSPGAAVGQVAHDPALAVAMGAWRAVWRGLDVLPELNVRPVRKVAPVPVPGMLAGMNRDVCSFLAASGRVDTDDVAIPRNPGAVAEVVRLVQGPGDAIERAGQIWKTLVVEQPFAVGNTATAVAFVKWFLASSGVEPTGVSVLSRWPVETTTQYEQFLAQGDPARVVAESLIRGCAEGRAIALAVQAGKMPT